MSPETADTLTSDTLQVPAAEASGTQPGPSKPALNTGKNTPLKTRQVAATTSSPASTPESGTISGGTSVTTGEPPAAQAPEDNDTTGNATPDLLPLAIFEPSVRVGCEPLTVTFANLSQNSHDWQWSFGDGQESDQKEPVHRFEIPGEYFVILTAEGDNHTVSTLTLTIVVHPQPEARFNIEAAGMPGNGKPVYFYNLSTGAESYEWHFGDGGVSHDREPVWNYDKAGRYTITLIARSASGCTDTMVMENAFDRGGPEIRFPNAFSPDMNGPTGGYYHAGDSNHDVFHPYTGEVPETYELKIYNRTGNLVFESHDFHLGWDGYYQGRLQPRGVYIWKTRGRFAGGKTFEEMGDVTMIYNVGP